MLPRQCVALPWSSRVAILLQLYSSPRHAISACMDASAPSSTRRNHLTTAWCAGLCKVLLFARALIAVGVARPNPESPSCICDVYLCLVVGDDRLWSSLLYEASARTPTGCNGCRRRVEKSVSCERRLFMVTSIDAVDRGAPHFFSNTTPHFRSLTPLQLETLLGTKLLEVRIGTPSQLETLLGGQMYLKLE